MIVSSITLKPFLTHNDTRLSDLNRYLSDKTYLDNTASPTVLDKEVYDSVSKIYKIDSKSTVDPSDVPKLPHLLRWLKHISSYSNAEMLTFSKNHPAANLDNLENCPNSHSVFTIEQIDILVRRPKTIFAAIQIIFNTDTLLV